MAETEASAAPGVDEDGKKTAESKPAEPEQTSAKSGEQQTSAKSSEEKSDQANAKDTVNKEEVVVDGTETPADKTGEEPGAEPAAAGAETSTENTEAAQTEGAAASETKHSLLDSFLNKSGLGKVIPGRKKKEASAAGGAEEAPEGGEKESEKEEGETSAAAAAAAAAAEGQSSAEKEPESSEKDEDKKERSKATEAKSAVVDFIRKPVARIFSHRSTEKKEGEKTVRSKSLDRIEDAEALNAAAEEGGAAGGGAEDDEARAGSAQAKHMKRWHSFKKMMAQKTHKRSGGGGGEEEGGGDSSTLDSKESGQKRWKLKRSWTFQGIKRDSSVVGISGKAKGGDKEGEGEGGEEAKAEAAEGAEEEKSAPAGGVGAVTQHANEIWTSFKKRVIPKSKRSSTEAAPEEDNAGGEEGSSEEGKDGKSAKAKRSHFGRAVSLKNFILRKGKSGSVDLGEGAKEEEGGGADGEEAETAAAEPAVDGETAAADANEPQATPTAAEEKKSDKATPTAGEKSDKATPPAESDAPVTNCENGCSNGHGDENHQDEEQRSPVKKTKTADDANAKIINSSAPCDKQAENV